MKILQMCHKKLMLERPLKYVEKECEEYFSCSFRMTRAGKALSIVGSERYEYVEKGRNGPNKLYHKEQTLQNIKMAFDQAVQNTNASIVTALSPPSTWSQ